MTFVTQRYIFCYLAISCLALFLRLYQLADIQQPVFDEVYFPQFAYQYIQQKPFFHSHPPLAKYTMQGAITLYHALPWVNESALGSVEFNQLNPLSYRWVNALLGFLAAILFSLSIWRLTNSHFVSCLLFAFVSLDGALIVASRFGLSNVHILFWGALSCYLAILSLQQKRWIYPVLLGISLGCVICVKWSGLSYWAISLTLVVLLLLLKLFRIEIEAKTKLISLSNKRMTGVLLCLIVVPALVYSALWIPDLKLNTKYNFVETHQAFFNYHKNTVTQDAHPYCSKWYTWPLMQRPVSYYFEKLPADSGKKECFKNVHLFANPILYWWSSLAILLVTAWSLLQIFSLIKLKLIGQPCVITQPLFAAIFILCGYFACWLPWALVSRCTFLYHYQSASVFSFMALAVLLTKLYQIDSKYTKVAVAIILLSIFVSFVYWLPIQLGIPLEKSAFYQRMWFSSWI